jgi:hypothetical protein
MSDKSSTVRIVHKERYNEQHLIDLSHSTLPPLQDGWVRLQNRIITIASYNLSYCALGHVVHWWDCYPVPTGLPAPYNNREVYGIVPGWGINEVVESNNPDLPVGTALYGHSPTSAFPVDLHFTRSKDVPDHFLEISEGRKRVMAAYQRFMVVPDGLKPENENVAAEMLVYRIPFEVGYVLNRFTFAHRTGDTQIHPFPEMSQPWSLEQADIKDAVIIALGAGGRACRAFVQQVATNRTAGSGPRGLVEVTSSSTSLLSGTKTPFKHLVLKYNEAASENLVSILSEIGPKRVVVTDFGGRNNIISAITKYISQNLPDIKIDSIGIGGEATFESSSSRVAAPPPDAFQYDARMNTSGIRVAAIAQHGEKEFFHNEEKAYDDMIASERRRGGKGIWDVSIKMKQGLKGMGGFEGAWEDLCDGKLDGGKALVFKL